MAFIYSREINVSIKISCVVKPEISGPEGAAGGSRGAREFRRAVAVSLVPCSFTNTKKSRLHDRTHLRIPGDSREPPAGLVLFRHWIVRSLGPNGLYKLTRFLFALLHTHAHTRTQIFKYPLYMCSLLVLSFYIHRCGFYPGNRDAGNDRKDRWE